MFKTANRDSPLILVDYGGGSIDVPRPESDIQSCRSKVSNCDQESTIPVEYVQQHNGTSLVHHTTL